MLAIETRRRLIKRCDPQAPLPAGDPLYIRFDDAPSTRGEVSSIDALRETIRLLDDSCQLFTGFPGTGKTTELRRLAGLLHESNVDPAFVIFIDFSDFIDVYTPISIMDILRVVAHCADREAAVAERRDPNESLGYLQKLFAFLTTHDVALKETGFEAYGAKLMLEIKNNPTFRQRIDAAIQGRFQQFVDDARDFIDAALRRIRSAVGSRADRVVVIADGLEQLKPLRDEDRSLMEASVEAVFLTHHELLKLPCHVIYTFPLWLRFRAANLGDLYSREPLILPMVRISDRSAMPYMPGIDKLTSLVRRRVEDLAPVFGEHPDPLLQRLIEASGGYPRDLIRLVRSLLLSTSNYPVQTTDIERVIHELARTYENTLLGSYVDLLALVHVTHELPNEDAQQLALFGFLFERWLILAYRNGDEWYDLHPLVLRAPKIQERLKRIPASPTP